MPDCDGAGTAERSYPTSEVSGGSLEEIPSVRGQGLRPGGPHARRAAAKRSYPTSEARGGGREDQPHTVAARAQEGLELFHIEEQKGKQ